MTVQKEVSAFNKEVDVEHFAGISSSLQAAFNQRESSSSINLFKVLNCHMSSLRSIGSRRLERASKIARYAMERLYDDP